MDGTTNGNGTEAERKAGRNSEINLKENAETEPNTEPKTGSGIEKFSQLGISNSIEEKLKEIGIERPTAVQAKAIPALLEGKSALFQSETGTGKTLAYLLPIFERKSKAIVLSPTVELSSQIKAQAQKIGMRAALLTGGAPIRRQIESLKEKPETAVGSPARILELSRLKKLRIGEYKVLVLDEADRLFSRELREETEEILESVCKASPEAQVIACSATLSKAAEKAIESAKKGAKVEKILLPLEDVLRKRIDHVAVLAERREKIDTLRKILAAEKPGKALVFTSRLDQVANIVSRLKYKNVEVEGLHAKTDKTLRKSIIDRFRGGKLKILVTSDLASRGLDIPDVTHIIQMDLPQSEDFFVHRAGRTARAGKTGVNIVIGDAYEMERFAALEKKLKIFVTPKAMFRGKLEKIGEIAEE